MRSPRIMALVGALLSVLVVALAALSFVQMLEIRELRDTTATLRLTIDTQSQDFQNEIAAARREADHAREEAAAMRQAIEAFSVPPTIVTADSLSKLQYPLWSERMSEGVRTITRGEYGADWPFPSDEAKLGCHGGEIIATVSDGDYMVAPKSGGAHFFLDDMSHASIFDAVSPEMERARHRLIQDGRELCKAVR